MFVSTAKMRNADGSLVFTGTLPLDHDTLTQARKAASRIWSGRAREAGHTLYSVLLVENGPDGFKTHERPVHDIIWHVKDADQDSPPIAACIRKLGEPKKASPPGTLTINGWEYKRMKYVGGI